MTPTAQIAREFLALRPLNGFNMIMADCPWRFDTYSEKGKGKSPEQHYACEPVDWIKSLPIGLLASGDAVLWLWAINPMLPQALEVMAAWGFTYKTGGHWAKMTKNGKQAFGTGYILRGAGEPFLIGTRGSPKTAKNVRSVIIDQIGEHSAKPAKAYEAAEQLIPDGRRIEVFSRRNRPGWAAWGDEVGKLDGVTV